MDSFIFGFFCGMGFVVFVVAVFVVWLAIAADNVWPGE
jgi:hypothetical protein